MNRTHGEIIAAILANLEMALACVDRQKGRGSKDVAYLNGENDALNAVIALIKTEAGLP